MSAISPDHRHLLALAHRAIDAESGTIWRERPEAAVDRHGAACDELWAELRRQIEAAAGQVPVLEHPSVRQIKMGKRMKAEIIAACIGAVEEALESIRTEGRR